MTGCVMTGKNLWMVENECVFVVNSLTIARVMELFDNLADQLMLNKKRFIVT